MKGFGVKNLCKFLVEKPVQGFCEENLCRVLVDNLCMVLVQKISAEF